MTRDTPDLPSTDQLRLLALGRWENEGGAEIPAGLREPADGEEVDGEPTSSLPATRSALNCVQRLPAPEQTL